MTMIAIATAINTLRTIMHSPWARPSGLALCQPFSSKAELFEKSSNPTLRDACRTFCPARPRRSHWDALRPRRHATPPRGQVHVESAFGSAGALDQISKQTPQSLCLAVAIVFDQLRLMLVGQAIETLVNGTTAF